MFLSRGYRDLGVAFQTHLRSQAWYIGEAKNFALLSSPNGYLLEPTEWPKGYLDDKLQNAKKWDFYYNPNEDRLHFIFFFFLNLIKS